MDLISACGLPVSSVIWQSASGVWAMTAVCKATFRLAPGVLAPSPEQEPLYEEDDHWDDDESRSLRSASDLVAFKPRADVLLVGNAFAPHGARVRSLLVRVCVGVVDKVVEVWCDRWIEADGGVREGAPFHKMSLRYERAARGDASNPVGVALDGAADRHGRVAVPNLQPPGTLFSFRGDVLAPIGVGPIAPQWPERRAWLHHHAARWSHRDWHARPLPEGMDPAYFNSAPPDQQTDFLRPDERIVLENLHREHARLVASLPGLQPQAVVERASGHRALMELHADTMCIDTDRELCTVVWRGRIGLTHPREAGSIRFLCEGMPQGTARMGPMAAASGGVGEMQAPAVSAAADATMTLAPGLSPVGGPALPFETSPWIKPSIAEPSGAPPAAKPASVDASETVFLLPGAASEVTLPFAQQAAPPAAPLPAESMKGMSFEVVSPPVRSPLVAFASEPGSDKLAPSQYHADDTHQAPLVAEPSAPPPMIGPLATADMGEAPKSVELLRVSPQAAPSVETALPARTAPRVEDYPVDRCARIEARIACNAGEKAEILRAENLDGGGWEKLREHWLGAIRAETDRRKKTLLSEYDGAYVEELEAQKGAIGVSEYARLAEAAERGAVGGALAAQGLPSGAWPNVHRVWIDRMVRDGRVVKEVRDGMATARAVG